MGASTWGQFSNPQDTLYGSTLDVGYYFLSLYCMFGIVPLVASVALWVFLIDSELRVPACPTGIFLWQVVFPDTSEDCVNPRRFILNVLTVVIR